MTMSQPPAVLPPRDVLLSNAPPSDAPPSDVPASDTPSSDAPSSDAPVSDAFLSATSGTDSPLFDTYVFDAYGTLFDVHSAVARFAGRIGPDAAAFSAIWRVKQLEYSWVRTLAGRHRHFAALTEEALRYCLQCFPAVDAGLAPDLLAAYRKLDAYPDVRPALMALRHRGVRLAVLSNGTPDMLADAVQHAGLDGVFDAVLSVETAGKFKTAPETYALVTRHFGVAPAQVSFQSSNGWDIAGATAFGFRTVWINRIGLPSEYADLAPSAILPSLAGLVPVSEEQAQGSGDHG